MKLKFNTETRTDASTWSGGTHVIVDNVGGGNATIAGKVLATTETIEFKSPGGRDHIEFDYDATASNIEITAGIPTNR